MTVDILAIAAHRDDVELTCAGTLLRAVDQGHRTGILDLTAGESGTRGSAALRAEEAERAAADSRRGRTTECRPARCRAVQHRRDAAHRGGPYPPLCAARRDPSLPGRPPSRSPRRLRAWARRGVSRRAGPVPRRWRAAPAAQAALLARLPGGSAQADVRRGHHRPVRAEDAGDPVLRRASSMAPRPPARSSRPARISTR